MATLMQQRQELEKKKRYLFLGVSGLGLVLTISISAFLGVPLLIWGGFLGWKWFQFRAKRGMRF